MLKNKLKKKYYDHLLLISYVLKYLTNWTITLEEVDHAEFLLDLFLKGIQKLYGDNKMTYNPHVAKHVCRYVRWYGLLWNFSTYPFEDLNGFVKRIIHGTNKLDIEVVNTLKICNSYRILQDIMDYKKKKADIFSETDKRSKKVLNEDEIEVVSRYCRDRDLEFDSITFYARIHFRSIEYTSVRYTRQKKRDNSHICWKDNQNQKRFGQISIFFKLDNTFVLVRELVPCSDNQKKISNQNIKFTSIHTEIRETYCLHVINLESITDTLIRIQNYVCVPGYTGKK